MGGKTYWVGKNLKYENRLPSSNESVIIDLLEGDDDRSSLQFNNTVCFSRDREGMDPGSKMKQVAQELRRQESEMRKRRSEQERLKTLSEQYDQLEKQYDDWGLPTSDMNLFIDLCRRLPLN